jgi:transcriptional regulator PpsR
VSVPPGETPDLGALSPWAPQLAETFVSLASDIALVIDDEGVIRNVAQGGTDPLAPTAFDWVGRPWVDTVSGDTRIKIQQLLSEVASTGIARKREVNHPLTPGVSIPVSYTAIRLGEHGPVLAVGRDLRAIAAIQQRFLDSQQDLERGYWRARQSESRYRLLFQVATDAVLVVDAENWTILEANHAAAELFDLASEHLTGRPLNFGFERFSRTAVDELLNTARATGRTAEIRARLTGKVTTTSVAATPFRADDAMRLMVRVRKLESGNNSELNTTLARLVDGTSDGVVVTDSSGRVLVANPAFLALAHLGNEADIKGRLLADWLGSPGRPLASTLAQVRQQGIARGIESQVKLAHGAVAVVSLAGALLTEGDQECIGFTLRPIEPAQATLAVLPATLRREIALLATRLGDLALPALLREVTALAERHLIAAALERSAGDTAAAAALLGIGKESLARRQRRSVRSDEHGPSAEAT